MLCRLKNKKKRESTAFKMGAMAEMRQFNKDLQMQKEEEEWQAKQDKLRNMDI